MMKNLFICLFAMASLLMVSPVDGRVKNPDGGISFSESGDHAFGDKSGGKMVAQNKSPLRRPSEKQNASLIKEGKYICPNYLHYKNPPVMIKKVNERKNSWTVVFPFYSKGVLRKNYSESLACFQNGNRLICPVEDLQEFWSDSKGAIVLTQQNDSSIQIDPDHANSLFHGGSSGNDIVIPEGVCKRN